MKRLLAILGLVLLSSCSWQQWQNYYVTVVHIDHTNPVMEWHCGGARPTADGKFIAAVDEACELAVANGDYQAQQFLITHETFGHPFDWSVGSPLHDVEMGAQCATAAALGYQPHFDSLPYCPPESVEYYKQLMREAGIDVQTQ
jgi:hypothetical protein